MSGASYVSTPVANLAECEHVFRVAKQLVDGDHTATMSAGLRAVRAKDKDLLNVLDRLAELATRASDEQYGETQRLKGGVMNIPVAQANLLKKAYEHALQGDACQVYCGIYGAAAIRAGLTPTPYGLRG